MLDDAARRGSKELLVLTGEMPEVNPEVAAAAARLRPRGLHVLRGVGVRAGARARACCRTRTSGVLEPRGPGAAARGERVDGPDARVGVRAPDGDRARRLADEAPAPPGWRRSRPRASCGSRSRAASWSASARPRRSGSPRSRRSPRCTSRHGHIQEVILQNFVPHPRYHGQEVGEIADRGRAGRGGPGTGEAVTRDAPLPEWATPITVEDLKRLVRQCRRLMPDVGIQIPPEPLRLVARAGARGRDRPRRAVGQRRPHLARASLPESAPGAQAPEAGGLRADRAAVRVSAVHRARTGSPRACSTRSSRVLVVHPAPGLRAPQRRRDRRRRCAARDREGARRPAR